MPLGDYKYIQAGSSYSGCPGTAEVGGWYKKGSPNPIVTTYKNPSTGTAYSWGELDVLLGVPGTTPSGTTTPTSPSTGYPAQDISGLYAGLSSEGGLTTSTPYSAATVQQMMDAGTFPSGGILWGQTGAPTIEQLLAGQYPQVGGQPPTAPTTPSVEEQMALMPQAPTLVAPALAPLPGVTPAPTFEAPEVPAIPGVTPAPTIPAKEVAPAPEYVPTAEEAAWAEMYGGTIQDIIKARGEGMPEETINLMIRQQSQMLTAREDENLRVMHNDMERRGITSSGLVFWNQQKIKGATTTAIANSITDIQIKSALMKMASFENALGLGGQFLGYLQEQSKMVYAGKMATWEAQTQADLIQYQSQISVDVDEWKMTNQYNLAEWQANTQALFAQWDKNSTSMIEKWKMDNQFSIAEWETRANYDLAVFQIDSQAKLAEWSAKMDIFKLGIAQAYAQANMNLAAQINATAAAQQFEWDKELTEMTLEAENKQAAAQGFGSMVGTTIGLIFKL